MTVTPRKPRKRALRSVIFVPLWVFEKLEKISRNEFKGKLSADDVADLIFSYYLENPKKMQDIIQQLKNKRQQEATAICQ